MEPKQQDDAIPSPSSPEEKKLVAEIETLNAAIRQKDEELRLRGEEVALSRGRWFPINAAQATIVVALIGIVSGSAGALVTAWFNRDIEAGKSKAQLALEKIKDDTAAALARADFESKLILKAVEAKSRSDATRNLLFFLSAGFIHDPDGKIVSLPLVEYPSTVPLPVDSSGATPTTPIPEPIAIKQDTVTTETDTDRDGSHDANGSEYAHAKANFLGTCQKLCLDDPKCLAYTFVPPGYKHSNWYGPTGMCWLKNPVPAATKFDGLISGVRVKQS